MTLILSFGRYSTLQPIFLILYILFQTPLISAYDTVDPPNTNSCNPGYGNPLIRWPCEIALSEVPTGSNPTTFTHDKASAQRNHWIQLPRSYADEDGRPACVVTIELEGHSQRDVSVVTSWDKIREITLHIIQNCVMGHGWGGWETYGLDATFRAMVPPVAYDGSIPPQPAGVENPDGSIDSVGLPENTGGTNGFNVPVYMLITVSGPNVQKKKERTDYKIGMSLTQYLRDQIRSADDIARQNAIARTRNAFNEPWVKGLFNYNHPRWWEFTLGPPTPHPENVKLTCAASLGSPSAASCETALFQFMGRGSDAVTIGPNNPLIRTAGNCAIGIEAKTKTTTSWDVLRSVAEGLLASCVTSVHPLPGGGGKGGFARNAPLVGRRRGKRQQSADESFPAGFTLSVYRQEAFDGEASETCAWDVASSHRGDVRKCPAQASPFKPPGRGLLDVQVEGNLTEVRNGSLTYVTSGDNTDTIEEGLTEILSDFPLLASSTTAGSGAEATAAAGTGIGAR